MVAWPSGSTKAIVSLNDVCSVWTCDSGTLDAAKPVMAAPE